MIKIMYCTLRDGGYYTNWDFSRNMVDDYCTLIKGLPVDYVEIGYRNTLKKIYHGEYYYLPLETLKNFKNKNFDKKVSIMLNTKEIKPDDIAKLVGEIHEYIDLVRFAVSPDNVNDALELVDMVSEYDLDIALNLMYISKLDNSSVNNICDTLQKIDKKLSYLYLVDSYGGIYPSELRKLVQIFKKKLSIPLGFHGHNNLELAFSNSMVAIEEGVEIIDATILGMGRGAGNLKTELILAYIESQRIAEVNYNKVSQLVSLFQPMYEKYKWGTNFAYMLAGSHSLSQKSVMDMMSKRRYTIEGIVLALEGMKLDEVTRLKVFGVANKIDTIMILGGGPSIDIHKEAISSFIDKNSQVGIIYASAHPLGYCRGHDNISYLCLTGNEALKLSNLEISDIDNKIKACVYPPSPRKMGTFVPDQVANICYELSEISFTNNNVDSPLAIALELSLQVGAKKILLAGFDGYAESSIESFHLNRETQEILNDFLLLKISIESLTPTDYINLKTSSVYGV